MKYICLEHPETHEEEIIVFPRTIDHDCMAEVCSRIKNQSHGQWHRVHRTVVSAGFVDLRTDGIMRCYGRSESLNTESRLVDTSILNLQFNR